MPRLLLDMRLGVVGTLLNQDSQGTLESLMSGALEL